MLRLLSVVLALLIAVPINAADLRIATFNTESDADTDPQLVAETIAAIGSFDLLAVQEVDGASALRIYADAAATAMGGRWRCIVTESTVYGGDREPDQLGIIFPSDRFRQLSTTELHVIRSHPDGTEFGTPDWGLRAALAVTFQDVATGAVFQVITIHLKCCGGNANEEEEGIRTHQSAMVADWIAATGLPTILLGDSNIPITPGEDGGTGPNQPAFDNLTTASGLTWIQPSNPVKTQCSDYNSMLDQVFVTSAAGVGASAEILFPEATYCDGDEQGYSDHRPVVALIPGFLVATENVQPMAAQPLADSESALEAREFLLQQTVRPGDMVGRQRR